MTRSPIGLLAAMVAMQLGTGRPAREPVGVVSGRVVEESGGAPPAGVTVKLLPQGASRRPILSSTDRRGNYVFADVSPGAYRLVASAADYADAEFGQTWPEALTGPTPRRLVELAAGETFRAPDLTLTSLGAIAGVITDEFGDPVPDIPVRAVRPRYRWRGGGLVAIGPGPAVVAWSTTDDKGRFRLSRMAAGPYYLQAQSSLADGSASPSGFAMTYFPRTREPSAAAPVQVRGGGITDAAIALIPGRTIGIRGTVLDVDGEAAHLGTVVLVEKAQTPVGVVTARATVSRDGTFGFGNVPPGDYRLNVFGPVDSSGYPISSAFMTLEGLLTNLKDLSVVLQPLRAIRGQVHFEEQPAEVISPASVRIEARPASWNQGPVVRRGGGRVRDDWTFSVERLAGRTVLSGFIEGQGQWAIRRIEVAGRDVTDEPLDVQDRDIAGVRITFSTKSSLLTGAVTDERGRDVVDYFVVAFADDSTKWTELSRHVKTVGSNQRGGFAIRGLPAGVYNVVALPFVPADEWDRSSFLMELMPHATKVFVGDGGSAAVSLRLR